jgi:GntR family phosphonate transport system transcriptional regulator
MVVRLEIVRSADRVPISVASTWLSAEHYSDAAKIFRHTRSITRMLEHYGIEGYRRKWTRISAAFTDAVDAGRLRLSVHRPILVVESVDTTADGRPLLTTRGRFAADRIALIVES